MTTNNPKPVVTGELKVTQALLPVTPEDETFAQLLANEGPRILRGIYRDELVQLLARYRQAHSLPGDVGMRRQTIFRELRAEMPVVSAHRLADAIMAALTPSALSHTPEQTSDVGLAGLKLAREIVAADLDDAIQHCDADWEGMSKTALEAIDAALSTEALSVPLTLPGESEANLGTSALLPDAGEGE